MRKRFDSLPYVFDNPVDYQKKLRNNWINIRADTSVFIGVMNQAPALVPFLDYFWHYCFITKIELLSKSGLTEAQEQEELLTLAEANVLPYTYVYRGVSTGFDRVLLQLPTLHLSHSCRLSVFHMIVPECGPLLFVGLRGSGDSEKH